METAEGDVDIAFLYWAAIKEEAEGRLAWEDVDALLPGEDTEDRRGCSAESTLRETTE